MELSYGLMFLTGFVGSLGHCVGMCGPLVIGYTLPRTGQTAAAPTAPAAATAATGGAGIMVSPAKSAGLLRHLGLHLGYNLGRITTYTLIGAVMGLVGSFVNVAGRLAGMQSLVSLIAGLAMIGAGLSLAGILPKSRWLDGSALGRLGAYQRLVQSLLRRTDPASTLPLGLILGLLPCGLLYTAEIAAAGTGSPLKGALAMLSFGLGTAPALILVGLMASSLGGRWREPLYRAASVLMIVTGGLFVWRGLPIA